MAKTTKSAPNRETLLQAFKNYVIEHETLPGNFFKIAKELKTDESYFYKEFSSPKVADEAVWKACHDETCQTLLESPEYENYSGREKTLAYFYTWIEVLLNNRSYVLTSLNLRKSDPIQWSKTEWVSAQKDFFNSLIQDSIQKGEIQDRKYLSDKYKDGFALTAYFIMNTWKNDSSNKFQLTDQAIEKSVNLLFDLTGKSPLDSMLDFGKFIFTQKPL